MHQHYLVRINGAWLDVRGEENIRCLGEGIGWVYCLTWEDSRDGTQGVATPGDYIRHYPRYFSDDERRAYARAQSEWGRPAHVVRRTTGVVASRREVGA